MCNKLHIRRHIITDPIIVSLASSSFHCFIRRNLSIEMILKHKKPPMAVKPREKCYVIHEMYVKLLIEILYEEDN